MPASISSTRVIGPSYPRCTGTRRIVTGGGRFSLTLRTFFEIVVAERHRGGRLLALPISNWLARSRVECHDPELGVVAAQIERRALADRRLVGAALGGGGRALTGAALLHLRVVGGVGSRHSE